MNGDDGNRELLCRLARRAFAVINGLLERDRLLARELRSSETGSRQIYREECITVEMAATLREEFPAAVEITLFTPHEESHTGADWYWRIEKGDHAIHARVQAKRVQRTEFGQADCQGNIDIDRPQLERLTQATSKAAEQLPRLQAWLATYVRFDATPPCGQNDLQRCSRHRHTATCTSHEPSLWIAHARDILNKVNGQRSSVRQIIKESVRLDCMLPCINEQSASGGGGPAAKGFILQSGLKTYQECVAAIDGDAALRSGFEGALRISVKPSRHGGTAG